MRPSAMIIGALK